MLVGWELGPAMPDDALHESLRPLVDRLRGMLSQDPKLLCEVTAVAEAFVAWSKTVTTSPASNTNTSHSTPTPVVKISSPATPRPEVVSIPANFDIPILPRFELLPPPIVPEKVHTPASTPLSAITARCRLKAEVARGFAEASENDTQISETDRQDWLRRAQSFPDCYLWMLYLKPLPPKLWRDLGGGYICVAEAAEMMAKTAASTGVLEEVLQLASEAQAVLFAAVASMDTNAKDYDQVGMYKHIRDRADAEDVFIRRFLRSTDRADPGSGLDVARRIRELQPGSSERPKDAKKEIKRALSNLKYKLKALETDQLGETIDWPGIVRVVDELVNELKVPPNHIELREMLMPTARVIPEEVVSPAMQSALEEVDRYAEILANREQEEAARSSEPVYNPDVLKVREYLQGTEMVFIGGDARTYSEESLKAAFGLASLNWIAVPRHSSTSIFEAPIARESVRVVIVATRWSSHSYQDVRALCVKHGKLFVKLPAGYHPNQLAHAILTQTGQRLAM
jgi:hypothetical protein